MKALLRFVLVVTSLALVVPVAMAQRQLGKKKGPTSKLFLAETKGEGEVTNEGRTFSPKQATAFDAPGTVLQTKEGSYQAFVYSNGTGMFVDENTRIEIDRFVQEPFKPDRDLNAPNEPSISQSDVFVARGQVALCTSQLVSGSTMNYSTPHAAVNIRGGKIAIRSDGDSSTVFLLDGDVTVKSGGRDVGGTLLRPGEQAVIRPGPPGEPPSITVGPIDRDVMNELDEKVSVACNAKKAVTFETIEVLAERGLGSSETPLVTGPDAPVAPGDSPGAAGSDSEQVIVARPNIPAAPPITIVVSPDRLGPGGQ
jgi:hypothetical protein